KLAILYPYRIEMVWWQTLAAGALLIAITAGAVWVRRSRPYLTVGWLWFVIGLLPAIGLVQSGRQAMADRFTYLPFLGLALAVIWGTADLIGRRQRFGAGLGAVVVAACAVTSWNHLPVWRDSVTIFSGALAVTTENAAAHHHLAAALEDRGRFEEA